MDKCKCYQDGYCSGTKEMDPCSCNGYKERCNFYDSVREQGFKEIAVDTEQKILQTLSTSKTVWHYCPYCGKELK